MIDTLDTIEVATAGGHRALFETRPDTNDAALAFGIISGAEYPFERMQDLRGWAIDVGAHIGIVTVALALDNPDLRVVAVEALPENVAVLRRNVARNGLEDRVTIRQAAAGRSDETAVDITYGWTAAQNQPDHYMRDNRYIGGMVGPNDTSTTIACPAVSLETLTADIDEVALLKIDCEGCEWHFCDSLFMGRVQRIVGELHWGKNGGAAEFRKLLSGFDVTMDDTRNVAVFEAVRR